MAVLTRSHPTDPDTERHYNGKKITAVTVDFAVNGTNFASTELGAEGALNAAIKVLTQQANPIIQSDIEADGGGNAGQVFQLYYEGEFGTDTYDGTNSETFAAYLQTELRLLTSVGAGSVNLSSATVGAHAL